ncbi:MAG: helix-turn-helix transcriptional regulator [Clostridia bacterium]|nr:helix-turn-helix transcriptional regulator [Clostridia bacterium]
MASKKIVLFDNPQKPIEIEYSNNDTYFGDTAVKIYDDYKISIALTDDCGAVIGDKVFFPKRGDMMIFRPNEIHFGRFLKSDKYSYISFLIPINFFDNFCGDNHSIIAAFLDTSDDKINLIRPKGEYRNKLIDLAQDLLYMMENNRECFDVVAFAKLIEALNICNHFYRTQKASPCPDITQPIVTKVMQNIDKNFPDFAGLHSLAEQCGCSVTHLTQTFRHYTGKSVHSYLTERRLEYARRLLQDGTSVTEACYQSGFSDCSGFIVLFKKHFNITPGKYKKRWE